MGFEIFYFKYILILLNLVKMFGYISFNKEFLLFKKELNDQLQIL